VVAALHTLIVSAPACYYDGRPVVPRCAAIRSLPAFTSALAAETKHALLLQQTVFDKETPSLGLFFTPASGLMGNFVFILDLSFKL